ncbi:fasciclin domain-containing protein [Erythrobacter sp. W302b]|uniref:fasciclin domain-containing protein n=1 Tax=Erythrobacter sp. W302b TaxID=3389874 RepID=UPI00396B0D10
MKIINMTFASVAALALVACASEAPAEDTAADTTAVADDATGVGTIVEVAQGDNAFSTLVTAVTAADLGATLSGTGPFTVFAPTNDAFAKLPAGTVEKLTTDDKETLKSILTYHVVPGTIDAATLTNAITQAGDEGYTITTVQGATLNAKVVDGGVVLTDAAGNTAKVTATDVAASNGVIHVIDTVLMPK